MGLIKKYKIKAKRIYTIILLTIMEMFLILWIGDWIPTPVILVPLIQFIAIFENRDTWAKLTEKEKEEFTLSEDELDSFVIGIVSELALGKKLSDILENIKRDI